MISLRQNETILLIIRKHWFLVAIHLVEVSMLAVIPLGIAILLPLSARLLGTAPLLPVPLLTFGFSLYGLMLLAALFYFLVDYYLDMWVITNQRILDIEQKGFFSREVSEIPISRVQDVTIEVHGIIRTLLGYGTIRLQTAGEREFNIRDVPRLERIKEVILHEAREQNQSSSRFYRDKIQNDLDEIGAK